MKNKLIHIEAFLLIILMTVLQIPSSAQKNEERKMLVPVGQSVGIRLFCNGLIVTGFQKLSYNGKAVSPAKDSGLRVGDILLTAQGKELCSASDLVHILKSSTDEITLSFRRDDLLHTVTVRPVSTEAGEKKIGCFVRDSTAGLGTVTFYDPETGLVSGLGHPICDADTGIIMPVKDGTFINASIFSVEKGAIGSPGCLLGSFASYEPLGDLISNKTSGIYGILRKDGFLSGQNAAEVAYEGEIHTGDAEIICTLDESGPQKYDISICKVSNLSDNDTRDYEIRVTDPKLIEKTGGIVQGMSGSPILQDGRLIGAVTHVFINDPKKGYGIYIGTMLSDGLNELKEAG